jgi:hypothetical protein
VHVHHDVVHAPVELSQHRLDLDERGSAGLHEQVPGEADDA